MSWHGKITGQVQNRFDLPLKGSIQHVSEAERPDGFLDIPVDLRAATRETPEQYGSMFVATAAGGKTDYWRYDLQLGNVPYAGKLKCNIKQEDVESTSYMYLIIERNDSGKPQFRAWFPVSSSCKMTMTL